MELHQVEYFLAVVDHKGINAAASALRLAQPTVSQAIRVLERELGVDLFHRIGRGMVLTSAGQAFVGPARQVLRDVVAAEGALVDSEGLPRGRLDIHVAAPLAVHPVAQLVGQFRKRYPNVSLRLADLRDEEAGAALIRDGHCEIVFTNLPVAGPELEVEELGTHDYWLVCPPGTDVPARDPLPLTELPDLPLVIVPKSTGRTAIERALSAARKHTTPSAIVQHRESLLPFVLAGVGGTILARPMAEQAAARGAVVRAIDPPISLAYGVLYDPALLSPAGRAFLRLARTR
ncbi:LysR family transcriptional regulator [Saccharopolyspora sp. K220]|uniref:LysR family transcriptional regulator n=1 Tax=Saccharopolyspora soli TaxID=2926618 RepID=UPI001F567D9F|nr:LysR family transcriptional regulator [Saccharopolyspora soli]MCI2417643.1 LysR family transcriptional regulator [Saccharopolyspora soli]